MIQKDIKLFLVLPNKIRNNKYPNDSKKNLTTKIENVQVRL